MLSVLHILLQETKSLFAQQVMLDCRRIELGYIQINKGLTDLAFCSLINSGGLGARTCPIDMSAGWAPAPGGTIAGQLLSVAGAKRFSPIVAGLLE